MRAGGGKRTLDDWHDSTLLDSRRALETVCIDTWRFRASV